MYCEYIAEALERGKIFEFVNLGNYSTSRLYSKEYENCMWVTIDPQNIIFEELCENFEVYNDMVVTQVVHLQYEIEGECAFITHLDHEYVFYTIDEYENTSNRQVFCSKDCCYQARQDKTKADREAEKGDHYYRQRVCAVCGSTYWPTHSQQKFCSEECKKINHNKKTLEFYHKKQKEKALCKDLLQTKEQVSDTNSSEITIIPA